MTTNRQRRQQPGNALIDQSSPLARRLTGLWAFSNTFRNTVGNGRKSPVVTGSPVFFADGEGFHATAAASAKVDTGYSAADLGIGGATARTIIVSYDDNGSTPGGSVVFAMGSNGGTGQLFEFARSDFTTVSIGGFFVDSSNFTVRPSDSGSYRIFCAISLDGSNNLSVYVITRNLMTGVVSRYSLAQSGLAFNTNSVNNLTFLSRVDGSSAYTGAGNRINFLSVHAGRVLTVGEIEALYSNRWQLFQGQQRRILIQTQGGAGATASPTGVGAVATVGAPQVSGGAQASPSGIGAVAVAGIALASGAALAAPGGVAATASVGTAYASAGAAGSPTGVAAASSVGAAAASGGASVAPSGVAAAAAVGAAAATGAGAGTANPVGVSASGSVGTPMASAGAAVNVAGVGASFNVGTATATGAVAGAAAPAGVSGYAQVGTVTTSASGRVTPAGVSAVASVGVAVASGAGAGVAMPVGVSATGGVGAPQVAAGAKAVPAGVTASGSVGTAIATGGASVSGTATPVGVGAVASTGQPSVSAGARAAPVGISATVTLGQVIASGNIIIGAMAQPAGVTAFARVGQVVATGTGTIVYARAPDGAGFTPQQREQAQRPAQVGSARPPNTQGFTR